MLRRLLGRPSAARTFHSYPIAFARSSRRMTQPFDDPIAVLGEVSIPHGGVVGLGPGPTLESAVMAKMVLQENHVLYHCFFNKDHFHNHLSHHVLAAYSLGAPPETIKGIYEAEKGMQQPIKPLAEGKVLTSETWRDHFGDENFYANYVQFWWREISQHGVKAVMDKYVFSDQSGAMFIRLFSGAIHPFIQLGHGVEFGLDALVAEGLAQTAIHDDTPAPLFPKSFFAQSSLGAITSSVSNGLGIASKPVSFVHTANRLRRDRGRLPRQGLSAFQIADRIMQDPNLGPGRANKQDDFPRFGVAIKNEGRRIRKWCEEWVIDENAGWDEIVAKAEELIWLATVIYAASTRPGYKPYRMDFFLMHGVTSSLFLVSALEAVSPKGRVMLLHGHFRTLIGYWISRGRPALHIEDVLMKHTATPLPPNAETPASVVSSDKGATPQPHNPWLAVAAHAAVHPDEHLTKTIRTLMFAASTFGTAPPGVFKSSLAGTEVMDGTIFIRAAGMTLDTIGWDKDTGDWDRSVLGFDKAWEDAKKDA